MFSIDFPKYISCMTIFVHPLNYVVFVQYHYYSGQNTQGGHGPDSPLLLCFD